MWARSVIAIMSIISSNAALAGSDYDWERYYENNKYVLSSEEITGKRDPGNSIKILNQHADAGEADAYVPLALALCSPYSSSKDVGNGEKAVRALMKASDTGITAAMVRLGEMLEVGRCVRQDLNAAQRNYVLAAQRGDSHAAYALGNFYADEFLHKPYENPSLSFKWMTFSANLQNYNAVHVLEKYYTLGYGTSRNYKLALELMKLSASHGNTFAMDRLADYFHFGIFGVKVDLISSYVWFGAAESVDPKHAWRGTLLTVLESEMTPAQIGIAQKLTEKCIASNYQFCENK